MTPIQRKLKELRERQSRERGRMAELAVLDSLGDEQRQELDEIERGTPDLERQIRAAMTAIDREETEQRDEAAATGADGEMRERLELRSRASLTNYLRSRMSGMLPSGAEAELNAAAGIGDGIPLELWDVPTETRADAPTGAPGTVGVNLDPIRPAVFANSVAPRLGIDMPRVGTGTYASATITTSTTAGAKAKSAVTDSTAAAFTVTTATPKRVSARLSVTLEDVAAVGQANFESALRENLSLVLSDELDDQALNGNGSAPNLNGIFQRLTDPSAPAAGVVNWAGFASQHAAGVDGLWANTIQDVSIVVNPETYRLAAGTFQGTDAEMSAAAYATANTGGFWTNKRMPDKANHVAQAILYRKGRSMMGGAGAMRTAVCPHWNEISIDDIYSGSANAERYFTVHVLLGDVILVQPDAYAQIAYRVSS